MVRRLIPEKMEMLQIEIRSSKFASTARCLQEMTQSQSKRAISSVFPKLMRMPACNMKSFDREKIVGIISKLGGEEEKQEAIRMFADSSNTRDKLQPLC
jgi:hypothetical protein